MVRSLTWVAFSQLSNLAIVQPLGPWNCQKICDVILYPPLELGITGERVDEEAARAESCLAKFKDFRYATLKDCQVYGSKSALIGKIS